MPVSDVSNISPIMREVQRLNPNGVIDLGIGVGKYGALCREVLDGTWGRVKPDTWERTIVGVEGFEAYDNPLWKAYNKVMIADFTKYYEHIVGWPLVLMVDSLEHVEPTQGAVILDFLVRNNKNVIVSVPLGNCPQGEVFNNPLEQHRTTYHGGEFDQYKYKILHRGVCLVVSIGGALA